MNNKCIPKKDCFAYIVNKRYKFGGTCTCLNALYCATEDCKFYKQNIDKGEDYVEDNN